MMNLRTYYIIAVLALIAALATAGRVTLKKMHFDRIVSESHKTSEGYDQKFIDMVNHLEDVLASRASFGFLGGKDPMTGQVRQVVSAPPPAKVGRGNARHFATAPSKKADQFKLTAIIFDDRQNQYTAIVMDGERSFSVETSDVVAGRKVVQINQNGIVLESATALYFYDIRGNRQEKPK